MRTRTLTISLLLVSLALGLSPARAQNEDWPKNTVRFVTPLPAGSGAETMLRVLAKRLADDWKVTTYVENKPGGNTVIAASALLSVPADGNTILFTTEDTFTTLPFGETKLSFDPNAEFTPVTLLAISHLALVANEAAPYNNLEQLVAAAKAKPGGVTVATLGPTSAAHYLTTAFAKKAGVEFLTVPHRGITQANTAVLQGDVDLTWANAFATLGFIEARKMKVIAVTGPSRNEHFPDTASFAEQGYGDVSAPTYFGIFVGKATPGPIVKRLTADIQKHLAEPEVQDMIKGRGFLVGGATGDKFYELLQSETKVRKPGAQ